MGHLRLHLFGVILIWWFRLFCWKTFLLNMSAAGILCKKRENKNPWTYSYVQGCIHTVPPWFSLIYPLTRGTAPFPILLYAVTHVRTSLTRLRTGIRQSLVCGHSTNRPALWILPTDYCFPQCLCCLLLFLIISPDSDLSRPASKAFYSHIRLFRSSLSTIPPSYSAHLWITFTFPCISVKIYPAQKKRRWIHENCHHRRTGREDG